MSYPTPLDGIQADFTLTYNVPALTPAGTVVWAIAPGVWNDPNGFWYCRGYHIQTEAIFDTVVAPAPAVLNFHDLRISILSPEVGHTGAQDCGYPMGHTSEFNWPGNIFDPAQGLGVRVNNINAVYALRATVVIKLFRIPRERALLLQLIK